MTYKKMNLKEIEDSIKSLLPNANEFDVEFSLDGNGPAIARKQVMNLESILELVGNQGFRVNDISDTDSDGIMKECIGITLNKPFIDKNTKEIIEGIFILGNVSDKCTNYLFSFLFEAVNVCSEKVYFSVDIVAKNKKEAKNMFLKKVSTFKYPSKEKEICIRPLIVHGEWLEMESIEDEGEVRFSFEHLTADSLMKLF